MTKSGVVTQVVEKHVSKGSATPRPKGAGPQRPQNFWDLLHARTQYEKQQPNFAR